MAKVAYRELSLFEYSKSLLRTLSMLTASTNQMKSPKCEKLYQGKGGGTPMTTLK